MDLKGKILAFKGRAENKNGKFKKDNGHNSFSL